MDQQESKEFGTETTIVSTSNPELLEKQENEAPMAHDIVYPGGIRLFLILTALCLAIFLTSLDMVCSEIYLLILARARKERKKKERKASPQSIFDRPSDLLLILTSHYRQSFQPQFLKSQTNSNRFSQLGGMVARSSLRSLHFNQSGARRTSTSH
jgi:hypothetical protein